MKKILVSVLVLFSLASIAPAVSAIDCALLRSGHDGLTIGWNDLHTTKRATNFFIAETGKLNPYNHSSFERN